MQAKKHEFYGVDLKTEWLVGLLSGAVFIIIWVSLVVFYYWFNQLDSILRIPVYIFFGAMFLGLTIFIIFLRKLGKRFRKKWIIEKNSELLKIHYTTDTEIYLDKIQKIVINGGNGMRYFTIQTPERKIKIRMGTSYLTPFSEEKDIQILDSFITDLDPYLNKNFTKKDRTVSLSPPGTIKLTYKRKKL